MGVSLLKAKKVIATDLQEIIDINTKANVDKNRAKNNFDNLIVTPLAWGNKDDIDNVLNECNNSVDLIIVCECLYVEVSFKLLYMTLIKLSKKSPKSLILFAYKKRYIYQDKCIEEIKKRYEIVSISREEFHKDFIDKDNYQMFYLKYKE